jgi:hypothetical protein
MGNVCESAAEPVAPADRPTAALRLLLGGGSLLALRL